MSFRLAVAVAVAAFAVKNCHSKQKTENPKLEAIVQSKPLMHIFCFAAVAVAAAAVAVVAAVVVAVAAVAAVAVVVVVAAVVAVVAVAAAVVAAVCCMLTSFNIVFATAAFCCCGCCYCCDCCCHLRMHKEHKIVFLRLMSCWSYSGRYTARRDLEIEAWLMPNARQD